EENKPGFFVWHARMLENILVEPDLLTRVLRSHPEIEHGLMPELDLACEQLAPDYVRQLIEYRIGTLAPEHESDYHECDPGADPTLDFLLQQKLVAEYRITQYDAVSSQAQQEVRLLQPKDLRSRVDGKRL